MSVAVAITGMPTAAAAPSNATSAFWITSHMQVV